MIYNGGGATCLDSTGATKIIATGYAYNPGSNTPLMFVVRFNADGSLDTTFGDIDSATSLRTGKNVVQIGTTTASIGRSIAVGVTNRNTNIYIGGGANGEAAVFKMRDNGDLDTTFNGVGYLNLSHSAVSVALQADGKLIVGGTLGTPRKPNSNNFAVSWLLPSGQSDPTFGVNGRTTTDFFGLGDILEGLTLDNAGKIVATGQVSRTQNSEGEPAVARYSSSGQLEAKNTVRYDSSGMKGVVVQPDGKIVVLGAVVNCNWQMALTRFNASDLSLDMTFGNGGTVYSTFAESNCVSVSTAALAIQMDPACNCPKIIAGGAADTTQGYSVALARFVP